ncbi:unnamed protein product, partial [Linum tenue]
YSLAGIDSDIVLCEIENKEKKRLRVDDERVLCETVNKGSKRLRMDEEGAFLTATKDAGVLSSLSEMVMELASDFPCSPSVGHSAEQIQIQCEVQAVANGGLSCGDSCDTLAASMMNSEEETMSSLQSSINNPTASSSSSLIPVASASDLDVSQPQGDFSGDLQLGFLTSCGTSELIGLPMFEFDDNLCNLLEFDTSVELDMTGLWSRNWCFCILLMQFHELCARQPRLGKADC